MPFPPTPAILEQVWKATAWRIDGLRMACRTLNESERLKEMSGRSRGHHHERRVGAAEICTHPGVWEETSANPIFKR